MPSRFAELFARGQARLYDAHGETVRVDGRDVVGMWTDDPVQVSALTGAPVQANRILLQVRAADFGEMPPGEGSTVVRRGTTWRVECPLRTTDHGDLMLTLGR
ncbi:hypothetical protein [Rhodoplanes sp. SY1]|uniref:head-tail joining protein n=1 Tax=Rhodoplanes sp. SY1 TaxID=3166646 RepID=UPI0038B4254E